MGITELLAKIGDDNIGIQPLDNAITDMRMKKGHNAFTFNTDVPFDLNGTEKLGIVVWLDRTEVKKILGN